uniref:Putative ribose-5-phosphate isomerase 4ic n=1 Tax=Rhizophora mucronata TaxID=61149 RepID=A0A2P2K266_RHIMU
MFLLLLHQHHRMQNLSENYLDIGPTGCLPLLLHLHL